jgi:hypothetical protein
LPTIDGQKVAGPRLQNKTAQLEKPAAFVSRHMAFTSNEKRMHQKMVSV